MGAWYGTVKACVSPPKVRFGPDRSGRSSARRVRRHVQGGAELRAVGPAQEAGDAPSASIPFVLRRNEESVPDDGARLDLGAGPSSRRNPTDRWNATETRLPGQVIALTRRTPRRPTSSKNRRYNTAPMPCRRRFGLDAIMWT